MSTIVAGIDEVGFGPILGPLVVSSSIFLIAEQPEADIWDRLQNSISKSKKSLGDRVLVCDSKKAYSRQTGFKYLERTVRAFLNQLRVTSTPFSSILPVISNDLAHAFAKYPWYNALYDDRIPEIDQSVSNRLSEEMKCADIEFIDFRAVCTDVAEFNEIVDTMNNKAWTVIFPVLELIRQIISIAHRCSAKKIIIYCDRLGGRKSYGNMLQDIPGHVIHYREESSTLSKYELISTGKTKRSLDIQFEVKSDDKYLPVALASMVGKYIREKVMQHMNEYMIKLQPGLEPTAGYWTDGWRFLGDLEDKTLDKAHINRTDLIRNR